MTMFVANAILILPDVLHGEGGVVHADPGGGRVSVYQTGRASPGA